MASSGFSSHNLSLRVQKKVLGKLSNKTLAKSFVDDELSQLLDTLHLILSKEFESSDVRSEKIVKNLIKIIVKLGILYKNNQFNDEELQLGIQLRKKLRNAALTIISFYEVDFSYDPVYLISLVSEINELLHKIVERHLTQKSHARINSFTDVFQNKELLDKVFLPDGDYHSHLATISKAFDKVVESEW
ncbi:PREDICTED: tumor necrosis factor alpha-induced protein 8-like [Amphimedon queenslandica]|uniref:Tumor necrosis factor alpha-induced protein 8-like protein n=1 Tax=Amphimedon queenslandica TaxID=400682 RepID=A0AAN0IQI1_AMPQE|nr:PREDICTED: tumor necrosis factor alpha-induced protein 8-like [Amphimedon queenslandica]|eukprot:XP_011406311.1 PREDICTED: tumor necrosis factor alpha-induced protein 8-like [Amphimedon queenslandica]